MVVIRAALTARWTYRLLRWSVALYFVLAGIVKATDPLAFAETVSDYGLVWEHLVLPTAMGLIAVELAAGLGLLGDLPGSLPAISGLLVLFVAVLSYGLYLGLDIDCNCLGIGQGHSLQTALAIDLGLLLSCAYLYWWRRQQAIAH